MRIICSLSILTGHEIVHNVLTPQIAFRTVYNTNQQSCANIFCDCMLVVQYTVYFAEYWFQSLNSSAAYPEVGRGGGELFLWPGTSGFAFPFPGNVYTLNTDYTVYGWRVCSLLPTRGEALKGTFQGVLAKTKQKYYTVQYIIAYVLLMVSRHCPLLLCDTICRTKQV